MKKVLNQTKISNLQSLPLCGDFVVDKQKNLFLLSNFLKQFLTKYLKMGRKCIVPWTDNSIEFLIKIFGKKNLGNEILFGFDLTHGIHRNQHQQFHVSVQQTIDFMGQTRWFYEAKRKTSRESSRNSHSVARSTEVELSN